MVAAGPLKSSDSNNLVIPNRSVISELGFCVLNGTVADHIRLMRWWKLSLSMLQTN